MREDGDLSNTEKGAGRGRTGKCGCAIRNMEEKSGTCVSHGAKRGESF